jgi:hypothetical protein
METHGEFEDGRDLEPRKRPKILLMQQHSFNKARIYASKLIDNYGMAFTIPLFICFKYIPKQNVFQFASEDTFPF